MDSIHRALTLMSVLSDPSETNRMIRFRNAVFGVWLFIWQCVAVISSAAYFYRFVSNDLESSLYAVVQMSAHICTPYTIAMGYIQRKSIEKILMEFRTVRESRKFQIFEYVDLLWNGIPSK